MKCFKIGLILYLLILLNNDGFAVWEQCKGSFGGDVKDFAINSSGDIYVAIYGGGIYFSKDDGESWNGINNNLPSRDVYNIMIKNDIIFAATMKDDLLSSTNNGKTWEKVEGGLYGYPIKEMVVSGNNILIAMQEEESLFLSSNNGKSWKKVLEFRIDALTVSDSITYAGNFNSLYKSIDCGEHWTPIKVNDETYPSIKSLVLKDGKIIFADGLGKIFISSDAGITWKKYFNVLPSSDPRITLKVNDDIIVAGLISTFDKDKSGIYISTDNGITWSMKNRGLTDFQILKIEVKGNNIFAGTYSGVFKSEDEGNNWRKVNDGINAGSIFDLVVNSNDVYITTFNNKLYHSPDNGFSWSEIDIGISNNNVNAITFDNKDLFIGTNNGVYKSEDNGITWKESNKGIENKFIYKIFTNENYILATTYSEGIYLSTNRGLDWIDLNDKVKFRSIRNVALVEDKIFVAFHSIGLFISTNSGEDWNNINVQVDNQSILDFYIDENTFYALGEHNLFSSNDKGNSWNKFGRNNNFFSGQTLVVKDSNIFIGFVRGVNISTNGGKSWTLVNKGLFDRGVEHLALNNNYIFAGTYGSFLFKANLSDIYNYVISDIDVSNKPLDSHLFPNPATDYITIYLDRWSPPSRWTPSEIAIYDVMGILIHSTPSASQPPLNEGNFRIDISNLAPGVYFVKIGDKVEKFVKI